MPDWKAMVRARLSGSGLHPAHEIDVVEELTQHIEDRYQQLRSDGVPEDEAQSLSLREIDGGDFVAELLDVLPKEQ
jgi:putative ABC transport system permease protein